VIFVAEDPSTKFHVKLILAVPAVNSLLPVKEIVLSNITNFFVKTGKTKKNQVDKVEWIGDVRC